MKRVYKINHQQNRKNLNNISIMTSTQYFRNKSIRINNLHIFILATSFYFDFHLFYIILYYFIFYIVFYVSKYILLKTTDNRNKLNKKKYKQNFMLFYPHFAN